MMKLTKHILLLTLLAGGLTACNDNDDDPYVPVEDNAVSTVFSIPDNEWVREDGGTRYTTTWEVDIITEDINYNGAVLTYISYDDEAYEAIPQVFNGFSFSYFTQPGLLTIDYQRADMGVIDPANRPGELWVKVVAISALALKAHPDLDPATMSLKEVERTFNIR